MLTTSRSHPRSIPFWANSHTMRTDNAPHGHRVSTCASAASVCGSQKVGLESILREPYMFSQKNVQILWQVVSDHLHFRPYSVATSQTTMVSPIRKCARIPPVGGKECTAKTADNDDKAQSGAPHSDTAAPLSRTTTR